MVPISLKKIELFGLEIDSANGANNYFEYQVVILSKYSHAFRLKNSLKNYLENPKMPLQNPDFSQEICNFFPWEMGK